MRNIWYTGSLDPGMFKNIFSSLKQVWNHYETIFSGIFLFSTFLGQESISLNLSSNRSTNKRHSIELLGTGKGQLEYRKCVEFQQFDLSFHRLTKKQSKSRQKTVLSHPELNEEIINEVVDVPGSQGMKNTIGEIAVIVHCFKGTNKRTFLFYFELCNYF